MFVYLVGEKCVSVLLFLKQRFELPIIDIQFLTSLLEEFLFGGINGVLLKFGLVNPAFVFVLIDFGSDCFADNIFFFDEYALQFLFIPVFQMYELFSKGINFVIFIG